MLPLTPREQHFIRDVNPRLFANVALRHSETQD
jgi:hypothetical protein